MIEIAILMAAGYREAQRLENLDKIDRIGQWINEKIGPAFWEAPISLDSRADLGKPKESVRENKEGFIEFLRR